MDSDIKGFLVTAASDGAIFSVAFIIWFALRRFRGDRIPSRNIFFNRKAFHSRDVPVRDVGDSTNLNAINRGNNNRHETASRQENVNTNKSERLERGGNNSSNVPNPIPQRNSDKLCRMIIGFDDSMIPGKEARMYLFLSKCSIGLFMCLTIIGIGGVLPLYMIDPVSTSRSFFEKVSAESIWYSTWKMRGICWLTNLYAITCYIAIIIFWRQLKTAHNEHSGALSPENSMLILTNMDSEYRHPRLIRQLIERHQPGSVMGVNLYAIREKKFILWEPEISHQFEKEDDITGTVDNYVAFVVLKDEICVKNALSNNCLPWISEACPPPTDLNWKSLNISKPIKYARFVWLNIILAMALSCVIFLVTQVIGLAQALLTTKIEETRPIFFYTLTAWFPPTIMRMINGIAIPGAVGLVGTAIGFRKKSSRAAYVIHGNIIFLLCNTLFLPLMSSPSIIHAVEELSAIKATEWTNTFSSYLAESNGGFAIYYLLHCCLLAPCLQLLQPGNFSIKCHQVCRPKLWKCVAKPFDFGYWYAFNLSILTLTIIMGISAPLVLPLGTIYYLVKYYVDKYNFTVNLVYSGFESHGNVTSVAVWYMIFAVTLMQIGIGAPFLASPEPDLKWGGIIILASCTIGVGILIIHRFSWQRKRAISNLKDRNRPNVTPTEERRADYILNTLFWPKHGVITSREKSKDPKNSHVDLERM